MLDVRLDCLSDGLTRRIRTKHTQTTLIVTLFNSSTDFANAFVACDQKDDGDQGKDQGKESGDSPLSEYNAEVLRFPRE